MSFIIKSLDELIAAAKKEIRDKKLSSYDNPYHLWKNIETIHHRADQVLCHESLYMDLTGKHLHHYKDQASFDQAQPSGKFTSDEWQKFLALRVEFAEEIALMELLVESLNAFIALPTAPKNLQKQAKKMARHSVLRQVKNFIAEKDFMCQIDDVVVRDHHHLSPTDVPNAITQ